MEDQVSIDTRNVFFVTSTLPMIHGGRTKSLLQRANLLNKEGIDITIVSTNYNPEYGEVYSFFRENNRVLENTHFENVYDYYRKKNSKNQKPLTWRTILSRYIDDLSKYVKVKRSSRNDRTYFYSNGVPKFVIKGLDSEKVTFFALFRDWNFNPFKFFYVNSKGYVHRVDTYDVKGVKRLQEFFTKDGSRYLVKEFNNKGRITKISLNTGRDVIDFPNEKNFIAFFFNNIFSENDIIVNDARLLDKPLLESRVGRRIFQLHNPHLADPLDIKSGIKSSFKNILNSNFPENDVIVTLTEKQKLDIITEVPKLKKNVTVISHSTKPNQTKYKTENNHFGVICRLDPQKNLQDAIRAFYLFNKENMGYYLDIFGDGASRDELQTLTQKLGLEKEVIFHGNVQNVDQAYQKVFALLITSNFEGFPLNALESISNGTPIITYEVNYGPTDIVDEKSGWVTDLRSPESLKNQMVKAINNPKSIVDVQKRSEDFSEESFISKWLGVINYGL